MATRLFNILLLSIGWLSLHFAIVQIAYPIEMIQATRGLVIGEGTTRSFEAKDTNTVCYQARFVTQSGTTIDIDFASPFDTITPGDVVPIVYFPWNPFGAQMGQMDRLTLVAPALQQFLALSAGILGITLIGIGIAGYARSFANRKPKEVTTLQITILILSALILMSSGIEANNSFRPTVTQTTSCISPEY